MIPYAFNMLLAIAWAALTENFSAPNLAIGFVLGYLLLAFSLRGDERFARYVARIPKAIRFLGFFIRELVRSNLRVAYDVITPTHLMRPAIIELPLRARNEGEITVLANLISLTPGSLSLSVSDDQKSLYVHVMYLDDEQATLRELQDLERRILELLR